MNTTAGSFALLGSVVARDAGVVSKLRKAGAIILGLKPTVGLTTRSGVIPVSPRQDTIGPICRTVSDAVHVLDAIVGLDENDPATREASKYIPRDGYKQFLRNPNRLKGELVASPVRTLADVVAFNQKFVDLTKNDEFGQDIFLAAEGTNGIGSLEKAALANLEQLTRDGFEKLMLDNYLDALVTPGPAISPILAIGGFPGINVPAGYDEKGVPFGISFGGLKGTEPKLIQLAYGFEQATMVRKPPTFLA
ncbi:Probable amidase At4g34880 [Linum grandiflorum]